MDEYHRRNIFNGIALGAFFVGILGCCYPFLQNAGLIPELSLGAAWPVMATGWLLMGLRYQWRDGAESVGARKTTLSFAVFFAFLIGTALLYLCAALAMGWRHDWRPLLAAAACGAIPAALYGGFVRRCDS